MRPSCQRCSEETLGKAGCFPSCPALQSVFSPVFVFGKEIACSKQPRGKHQRGLGGTLSGEQPREEGKPRACSAGGNSSTVASPQASRIASGSASAPNSARSLTLGPLWLRVGGFGSPLDVPFPSSVLEACLDRASRHRPVCGGAGDDPHPYRIRTGSLLVPISPHTCALPYGIF